MANASVHGSDSVGTSTLLGKRLTKPRYDWKRFWIPPDKPLSLSDSGFLPDPDGEFGSAYNPDVVGFDEIARFDCLILIGEPGIGKSTALEDARTFIEENLLKPGDEAMPIDMGIMQDERHLRERIFENDRFLRWKDGDHRLHLLLDSLDEARAAMKKVQSALVGGLQGVDFDRLHLRIACRTADRGKQLEQSLKEWFGDERFGVFELVGLRRSDVAIAAEANGINSDSFVRQVIDRDLQAFASKPITLGLLLSSAEADGELSDTKPEIYRRGCLDLCGEHRDETAKHASAPEKLLAVSGRIAAAMTLGGRSTITTDGGAPTGGDTVVVSSLVGGSEYYGNPASPAKVEVDEEILREVLASGLFSARGDQLGWFHQTVAEYLTARHLANSNLDVPGLASLLTTQIEREVSAIPQLVEVVRWLTQLHNEFRDFVIEHCPEAVLGGELRQLADAERSLVVQALFELVESQASHPWDHVVSKSLRHLNHDGLRDQVLAVIENRALRPDTRGIAIRIIADCNLVDLSSVCARIALSQDELPRTRTTALYALGDIGTAEARARVVDLATTLLEEDEDDEIKGSALRAIFPGQIDAATLFSCLTPPKKRSLIGAYSGFLHGSVIPNLTDGDLLPALKWVRSLDGDDGTVHEDQHLADEILVLAFDLPPEHDARPVLLDIVKRRLVSYRELIESGYRLRRIELTTEARRQVIEDLIDSIRDGEIAATSLTFCSPPLLVSDDISWAIERLRGAVGTASESAWADLVLAITYANANGPETLAACDWSDELLQRSSGLRAPVEIDSDLAKSLRKHFETKGDDEFPGDETDDLELEEEDLDRVAKLLSDFEDGDIDAWWRLGFELDSHFGRRRFGPQFDAETYVRLCGGGTEEQAARVLSAAKTYLLSADPNPEEWVGKPVIWRPATAAYRAIRLVAEVEPDWFDSHGSGVLGRWALVLVWWPPLGESDGAEFQQRVLERAFGCEQEAVTSAIATIVEANLNSESFASLDRRIDHLDFSPFEPELIQVLDRPVGSPKQRLDLMEYMISRGSELAAERAMEVMREGHDAAREDDARSEALDAASALVRHRLAESWPEIATIAHQNAEFGKQLVLQVGHRHDFPIWLHLDEAQLGALFEWLERYFPVAEDPPWENGFVAPRQNLSQWRAQILRGLSQKGTPDAVDELKRLEKLLPEIEFLTRIRHEAVAELARERWIPPTTEDIVGLLADTAKRYVASDAELRGVVLESFERLQVAIKSGGVVNDFWNTEKDNTRPKAELEISEKLKRWLDDDLARRGIIVSREVTVRTLPGGKAGESQDLEISAVAGECTGCADIVKLTVEVKGCWNSDIPSSIEGQLVKKYLRPTGRDQGVYLVAWFGSKDWTDNDPRKSASRCKSDRADLDDELRTTVDELNGRLAVSVATITLDVSL